jgi:hypothetical protein
VISGTLLANGLLALAPLFRLSGVELRISASLPDVFILKYGPFNLRFSLLAHLSLLPGYHAIYLLGFSIGATWEH